MTIRTNSRRVVIMDADATLDGRSFVIAWDIVGQSNVRVPKVTASGIMPVPGEVWTATIGPQGVWTLAERLTPLNATPPQETMVEVIDRLNSLGLTKFDPIGQRYDTIERPYMAYIGEVRWFLDGCAPENFVRADGSNVSRFRWLPLFSVLGTTYGAGDGSSTFGVPPVADNGAARAWICGA